MTDDHLVTFGTGHGHREDVDTIIFTFPQTTAMRGWRMVSAEPDESGYFLSVTWKRESSRLVTFAGEEMTISIEEYDKLKALVAESPTKGQEYGRRLLWREKNKKV